MKKLLSIALVLISISAFSQKKSDTLTVDISKYKFVKIADKVYRVFVELREISIAQADGLRTLRVFDGISFDSLRLQPKVQPIYPCDIISPHYVPFTP